MSGAGMKALCAALRGNSSLRRVDLARTGLHLASLPLCINSSFVVALSMKRFNNTTLSCLDLDENRIGAEGAI